MALFFSSSLIGSKNADYENSESDNGTVFNICHQTRMDGLF
jgi:hypothetical protein